MQDGPHIFGRLTGQACSVRTLLRCFVCASLMTSVAWGGGDGDPAMGINQQISLDADGLPAAPEAAGVVIANDEVSQKPASSRRSRLLRPLNAGQRGADGSTLRRPSIGPGKIESVWPSGLGALAIVLALVGVVAWAVRKWVPSARASDTGILAVVARTNLSPKHSASLLKIGNRFVVVGLSGDRMTTLCEVKDDAEVAALSARLAKAGSASEVDAFDDLLLDESSAYQKEDSVGFDSDPAASSAGRRSLGDLLKRVRRLQSKL